MHPFVSVSNQTLWSARVMDVTPELNGQDGLPPRWAHLRRQEAGRVDGAGPGPGSQGVAPRPERGLAVLAQVTPLDGLQSVTCQGHQHGREKTLALV